ncbi:MAG TPA: DUF2784 domain-containing protein [Thermoanaerobaculia bacterium]|nr:DUF2784 domain-containing protein [Thermoanaerobaculia bacterium]
MGPRAAILADLVLALHVAFVLFVVVGLVLIFVGARREWGWVRGTRFRLLHLAAIGVVVAQAWLGAVCPLTTIETALRREAGASGYAGGFVAHWLGELLYIDAPAWAFTAAYTLFGALVVVAWLVVRPSRRTGRR